VHQSSEGFSNLLRHLEEEGVIEEQNGHYSVHKKFLPIAIHDLVSGSIMIEMDVQEVFNKDHMMEEEQGEEEEDAANEML
jgi:hypothetical protein